MSWRFPPDLWQVCLVSDRYRFYQRCGMNHTQQSLSQAYAGTITNTHTQIHMHTCTHTNTHARTHVLTYTRTHTWMHARSHTHANTHTHTHIHTHTHTHTDPIKGVAWITPNYTHLRKPWAARRSQHSIARRKNLEDSLPVKQQCTRLTRIFESRTFFWMPFTYL